MNKKIFFLTVIGIVLFIQLSCDKENIEGIATDNIGLSQNEFNLSNKTHDIRITTSGNGWDFASYKFGDIMKSTENNTNSFSENWFSVTKDSKTSINIAVEENITNEKRILQITLRKKNYYDYINIIQNP